VTCAFATRCLRAGRARREYSRCHRPIRAVRGSRLRALGEHWLQAHNVTDLRARELLDRVLARAERDQRVYSELFEPSFQVEGERVDLFRFSYGFPEFLRAPGNTAETIADWMRPFGVVADHFGEVLRRVRHPCVEQVLAGIAWDGRDALRLKLYLQFRDDAGDTALRLAGAIVGARELQRVHSGRPLHLLCISHGVRGVVGVNAYFKVAPFDPAAPPSDLRDSELMADLAAHGVRSLTGAVAVHRMLGPDDRALETVSDVSVSPLDNELRWSLLRSLPSVARSLAAAPAVAELAGRFRIGVRWLTVSTGTVRRVTGYYILNEVPDPASIA